MHTDALSVGLQLYEARQGRGVALVLQWQAVVVTFVD